MTTSALLHGKNLLRLPRGPSFSKEKVKALTAHMIQWEDVPPALPPQEGSIDGNYNAALVVVADGLVYWLSHRLSNSRQDVKFISCL